MCSHSVAVTANVSDVAMLHEGVEERHRHDFVPERGTPLLEVLVLGQDRRGLLVTRIDELE